MKGRKKLVLIMAAVLVCSGIYHFSYQPELDLKALPAYYQSESAADYFGEGFETGMNQYGTRVFLYPKEVMKTLRYSEEYAEGRDILAEYGLYSWWAGINVHGCSSGLSMDIPHETEAQKQAHLICRMMDIYENSF